MIEELFSLLLGAGKEFALFVISMMPLVELRGAVPTGLATGMPWYEVLPICYIGNLLPIPFVLLFGVKLIDWLSGLKPFRKIATRYKQKLMNKSSQVTKYAKIGLLLFVAVPLPGTGAWSGAVIAALLNMPLKKAFISIALGVVIAGLLMTIGTHGVLGAVGQFT